MSIQFAFAFGSFAQSGEIKFKKEELLSKVINKKAPDFKLKDLQGSTVSLSSLKGKVVVVDFWATWCGPCIASFPAMQLVVNKYKDSANVVFLFVDTWESQETQKIRISEVTSIIKETKVNFKVLLDEKVKGKPEEYDVALKYQAENIPTKIVIGKDGNIKFKTVGFNGSKEYIMQEMAAMIDYAGK
jgi:thiol-disulfide isomerase/thioredoxin